MAQRTIEVEHDGHSPSDAEILKAARAALKDEGIKADGDLEFRLLVTQSGGPSKVLVGFTEAEAEAPTKADAKKS